jgi:phosphate transport system substrate-binding protein
VSSRRSSLLSAASVVVVLAAVVAFFQIGTDDNTGTSAGSSDVQPGQIECGTGRIAGAGSTFAKNIELQWIQDYLRVCPAAAVNYQATGSGAGIQSFVDAQVDFAGSDSLMKDDEQEGADARCRPGRAIHLPIAAGALVFTYNLPGVETLRLSPVTLAGIFQNEITRWDDPRVVADNPGVRLPRIPIQAIHRSDSSGTTDAFSQYLEASAGDAWRLGTGKELRWPGGQAAKGSDGVTLSVRSAPGGITYMEESFALANQLSTALLRNGAGEYVAPEPGPVSAALAAAEVDTSAGDVRVSIDFRSTASGIYPASAVTYAIVCDRGNSNPAGLRAFLGYAATIGQQSAGPLGYAPLPEPLTREVTARLTRLR